MRAEEVTVITDEEAKQFLVAGGEIAPSPERVETTRRVLNLCTQEGMTFTEWNQPLYPEFNWGDVEFFMGVEEEWDISLDDDELSATRLDTFGDLVQYLESYIAFLRNRIANEKARVTNANCATQSAFYALRRRLLDTGAAYYKIHGLGPGVRLVDVPKKHAEPLARELGKDYGLSLPLRRVLWKRIDAGAIQWAFFALSVVVCLFLAPRVPAPVLSGTLFCLFLNLVFGSLVERHVRYQWPDDYQTLGDVARKIAASAQTPAQAAS